MKVTIVLSGLGAGGTEHVANIIANHWAEREWQVSIVTLDAPSAVSYYPYDTRVSVHHLALPPHKRGMFGAAWMVARRIFSLRRCLRAISSDVVISFLTRQNILALIATMGMDVPVVISERSNPTLQNPGRIWNWLRTKLYPRAFGLVTMTKGARDHFNQDVRNRSWIIPNPVELPAGSRARRSGKTLAAVGRLETVKGFDLLLQAFCRIASSFPEWKLVIWGEGRERAALEELRDQLGLNHRVELPGVTETPGAWIETTDVFVLSSRYEGWPNALLEATAAGIAVVSCDCAWGPREMIEDGVSGVLTSPNDAQALAVALADMLSDAELRRSYGEAARLRAAAFNVSEIMPKWDELLCAACQQHGQR